MISFTQSRCNNHKPGMAHVFATPGGQSFLHLEVLSTILLWRCRHLRIPQLDKNSTTPPSPTDPTIDSIEPRKMRKDASEFGFNLNLYSIISTLFHQRQGKSNNCSWATWPDVPARSSSNGLFRGTNASSLCHKAGSRSRWDLTDHPKKCPVGPKDVRCCAHSQTCCHNKRQSLHKGPHCGSKAFQMNWRHKI